MSDLFFNSARLKYRYPFNGNLMTEDLFDLDQVQLDDIYKALSKQVKAKSEDSLLGGTTREDKYLLERVEIVKQVFQYKQELAKRAEKAAETRARNQRIMELIQQKEDGQLAEKSIEELRSMLEGSDGRMD